ncbi:MAG: tetratricopeptide repeat protein [Planctomycetes bacterium]|nr:tetratricopeptide repeat protein [Planctomycetota bacterium]
MKDFSLAVSSENSQSFDRLAQLLEISEGTFSFTVATYHTLSVRDIIIEAIKGRCGGIVVVSVDGIDNSILNQVADRLDNKKPSAIFVIDIETLVVNEETNINMIGGLNVSREAWKHHFQCPVIFWMPEYLTTIVSRMARDFWSWVSHRLEFAGQESNTHIIDDMKTTSTGDYADLISSMSYDDIAKRQAELEQWLADPPQDEKMQDIVARRNDELSQIYSHTAQYEKAEPLYKRALTINEASLGKDHPNVAGALNNLAQLYQATNRLKDAEQLMKRALAINETSLGKDHPNVAGALNNLAHLYQATNRLTEAEPLMKRALTIDESSLGKDHPAVAINLNNLATLYKSTNRLKEAEPLMKRVLTIAESSLGKDHPKVATALSNLAVLYQTTNRLKDAEPLMKRALAIDESSLGRNHPKVAIRLNNLAQLYQDTNRLKEAELLMKRALTIDESSLGRDHPDVARDLNNLAQLYHATNRLKDAEPLMKRTLEIVIDFTRQTGHRHPHLMTVFDNYSKLLVKMGDSQDQARAKVIAMAPDLFVGK